MAREKQYQTPQVYEMTATIASGASISEALDLSGTQLVGAFIPPLFAGTTLYVQAAPALDGTYARIQDGAGADVALTIAAGKAVAVPNLALIAGWQFIKLESSLPQTATDKVITLATRPL